MREMHYTITGDAYKTKEDIIRECRRILYSEDLGKPVAEGDFRFLREVFSYHRKWEAKSKGGVRSITTAKTEQGSVGFLLIRAAGSPETISFMKAIRSIPSTRSRPTVPPQLEELREAAREAISFQVSDFRKNNFTDGDLCAVSGDPITLENYSVDHVPPLTFDNLLFNFCTLRDIDPLRVKLDTTTGTKTRFCSIELLEDWREYHAQNCELRILSRRGNSQLPKETPDWPSLFSGENGPQR